ncbi:hypothetical protein C0Q70_11019 [Pomacea canaliculata]|uniref:Uncharacterized protein n=1 Tax=Pomacea canaliculata TaxID=400727 RepID=A0A2T7P4T5_POMCA|nr:hypothetical protein C0Q70_11019 [Pomacea canaliculata]
MAVAASSRQAAGDRRSWPIQSKQQHLLRSRTCFEAEDVCIIPESFIAKPADFHKVDCVSLIQQDFGAESNSVLAYELVNVTDYEGNTESGRRPSHCKQRYAIPDHRGRCHSFQDSWLGPPANLMAECGLYKMSEDSATCYRCGITLRSLTPTTCIWTHHRQFAPCCRHLQRAKSCNPTHLEGGQQRFIRHLSASDAEDSGIQVSRG